MSAVGQVLAAQELGDRLKEGFVQLHPGEDVWVRTDRGVTNLRWIRAVAVHRLGEARFMVFGHSGGVEKSKAIPLATCSSQEQAQRVLDAIAVLVGALDLRSLEDPSAEEEVSPS